MKNIFDSWTHFNKTQTSTFKGPLANHWLSLIQESSQQWSQTPYPTGEDWKYVKFGQLPTTFLHLPLASKGNKQVASQDFYCLEISDFSAASKVKLGNLPPGLQVTSHVDEIERQEDSFLLDLYKTGRRENQFAQSALSFAGSGLVFRMDKNFSLDRPLKIIFDLDQFSQKDNLCVFNLMFKLDEGAQADIYVDVRGSYFSGLGNFRFDFKLEKKSRLSFFSKELGGFESHFVSNLRADVKEGAHFTSFDCTLLGLWSRHNLQVNLNEVGAHGNIQGLYLNNHNFFCDHHTELNHHVGETSSLEDYRGILSNQAKAVFNGKVYIEEKAAKSTSEQINKNLMLSKQSEVNTKPELQIYNDDVKAAHGATIGQLDDEQSFYLRSRGYSEEQAFHVLTKAFVFDLIEDKGDQAKKFYQQSLNQVIQDLRKN